MAESADVLTGAHQQVLLPDLNAGCSMADMADIDQVEEAWEELARVTDVSRVIPITYMNSSAALKAFVGRHDGAVCTSSNARAVLTWALEDGAGRQGPVLPRPASWSQHRLRARVRRRRHAGLEPPAGLGRAERRRGEGSPPCCCGRATARSTSASGPSTSRPSGPSIPTGSSWCTPSAPTTWWSWPTWWARPTTSSGAWRRRPSGAVIGVATEIHLVKRLDDETPDKTVVCLDPLVCPCSTMSRIDPPHLAWVLEGLVDGEVRNRIQVDGEAAEWARVALERMLAIT